MTNIHYKNIGGTQPLTPEQKEAFSFGGYGSFFRNATTCFSVKRHKNDPLQGLGFSTTIYNNGNGKTHFWSERQKAHVDEHGQKFIKIHDIHMIGQVNYSGVGAVPGGILLRFYPLTNQVQLVAVGDYDLHGPAYVYNPNGILVAKQNYNLGKLDTQEAQEGFTEDDIRASVLGSTSPDISFMQEQTKTMTQEQLMDLQYLQNELNDSKKEIYFEMADRFTKEYGQHKSQSPLLALQSLSAILGRFSK